MGNQTSVLPEDDKTSLMNVKFYKNETPADPSNATIDEIHKEWLGEWNHLEASHSFIQWLFPIRESGLNFKAQPMTKHEASIFRKTPEIQKRLIKSYEILLDFYGFVLVNKATGTIARNPKTYQNRFLFLNRSFHNYLRITRIMKCLGICGFEKFKKPFLKHFVIEVFKYGNMRNATESLMSYWIPTLRNKQEIQELDDLVKKITGKNFDRDKGFGWGDEQTANWQTECYNTYKMPDKEEREEMKKEQNLRNLTENPDENVLTFPIDPYESIHQQKKSLEMQPDMWPESRRITYSDSDSSDSASQEKEQRKKNMRKNRDRQPASRPLVDEQEGMAANSGDNARERSSPSSHGSSFERDNSSLNYNNNPSINIISSNVSNSGSPRSGGANENMQQQEIARRMEEEEENEGDSENENESDDDQEDENIMDDEDEEDGDLNLEDAENSSNSNNPETDENSEERGAIQSSSKKHHEKHSHSHSKKTKKGKKESKTRLNFRMIKENERENKEDEEENDENFLESSDTYETGNIHYSFVNDDSESRQTEETNPMQKQQ